MIATQNKGMQYIPNKKYYVVGARSAWDTVPVGLFWSIDAAHEAFPMIKADIIREATQAEIAQYFNLVLTNVWYELLIDGYTWYTNEKKYHTKMKLADKVGGNLSEGFYTYSIATQIKRQLHDYQTLGYNTKLHHLNRSGITVLKK